VVLNPFEEQEQQRKSEEDILYQFIRREINGVPVLIPDITRYELMQSLKTIGATISAWQTSKRKKRKTSCSDSTIDSAVINAKLKNPEKTGGQIANDLAALYAKTEGKEGALIPRRRVNRIIERYRRKTESPTGS
jgi:hypothetical protein